MNNMNTQKFIKSMTGYKATNKNMQCTPDGKIFQFELNKWYEVEGEIIECKNGFHFCQQPSGIWSYYTENDTRIFKIEAEDVLDTPFQPGTDYKRVCRRIRLVEEIAVTGDRNTGYGNTGYGNTGDGNTGDRNTGDRNTGYGNTGDRNTGYGNTGYRNTGYGNITNYSTGFLCIEEPSVVCFDQPVMNMSRSEFVQNFSLLINDLYNDAQQSEPVDFEKYNTIPNITPERLKKYQEKLLSIKNK